MPILPLAALALLAIDPKAKRLDVSGAVSVELRGGRAPVTPVDDPEPAVLWLVTPRADMSYRTRTAGEFTLGYSPTVQYRAPNRLDLNRPLLMHQADLDYSDDFNARWTGGVNLSGTFGETGYNGVVTALGTEQAQTPDVDVLKFAVVSLRSSFVGRLTPRLTLTLQPQAERRSSVGVEPVADDSDDSDGMGAPTTVPEQILGDVRALLAHRVTPVDDLEYTLRPGVVDFDMRTTFTSLDSRVGWSRRLRPSLVSRLDAGLFSITPLRGSDAGFQAFPVGSATLTGALRQRSNHQIDGTIIMQAIGFFDRISEVVEPRAQFTAGITATLPPRWVARALMTAFTPMTQEPRMQGDNEIPQTQIQLSTPVTYMINDRQEFEFGTVMSVRGSHLRSENFEFSQLEAWLYVAYRIGGGTARGGDEARARPAGATIGRGNDGSGGRTTRQ